MSHEPPHPPLRSDTSHTDARVKIYFLPNLMTGANLFCGFLALKHIVEWNAANGNYRDIKIALGFILLACIFDLLDGRVARMGGAESPFGREFDSLADIISFGVAPAFLVYRVVLKDVFVERPEAGTFWNSVLNHPEVGWFIASIYLICGAFRLARFNCLAAQAGTGGGKEFLGFPIPAAAGMVSSLTLFMMWWDEKDFAQGHWRFALPVVMIFLSLMMVSEVKYPTFKKLDLRATKTFTKTLIAVLFVGGAFILQEKLIYWVLPLFFTAYLTYGFIRPRVSRKVRYEIEDDDDDEPSAPS